MIENTLTKAVRVVDEVNTFFKKNKVMHQQDYINILRNKPKKSFEQEINESGLQERQKIYVLSLYNKHR